MAKAKVPKTLEEEHFSWIESLKAGSVPGKPPARTNAERQKLLYIRRVALKEIEDLTRLAKVLPEDQQRQIFNKEKLWPFFDAVLDFRMEHGVLRKGEELVYTAEAESRRRRLLKLCYNIIMKLDSEGGGGPARFLAPQILSAMIHEGGVFPQIRAIYYQSFM